MLPLLLALLGTWQLSRAAGHRVSLAGEAAGLTVQAERVAAIAAVTPLRIIHFSADPMGYSAAVAAGMMRDGVGVLRRGMIMAQLREGLAAAAVLGGAASLAAGLAGLLAAAWAARRGLVSRAALDAAFTRIRRLLPVLLGVQIAGLTVACGAALLFEVAAAWYIRGLNRIEGQAVAIGLAVAGFVLWLGWLTLRELRRSVAAFTPQPLVLFGRAIDQAAAPGLWRLVTGAARGQAAALPDHLVAGLVEGFFVTAAPVALAPAGALLEGRTLHIPLPALAMLDAGETASVIAHELAHFIGEDAAYGLKFLPIHARIGRNLDALRTINGPSAVRWTQAPAFTLGLHMLDVFDGAVSHWQRRSEIEADAAGLMSSGADAIASALLRTSLVGSLARAVLDETWRHPRAAPADLVGAVVERAASGGLADPASLLRISEPGPGDSHPPPLQRIAALGTTADAALLSRAARAPRAGAIYAASLFADWDAMCASVSYDAIRRASEAAALRESRLRDLAAEQPATETALFQDIRRPVIIWSAVALGCLVLLALLALRLAGRPIDDPSAMAQLAAMAGGLLVVSAAGLARVVRLWRSARTPFLILHAEGFACRGLDRMVPWIGVGQVNMTAGRFMYVFIHLLPSTALPGRVSGGVRVSRRRRVVTLLGLRPRGLTPQSYLQLVRGYWNAARARAALEAIEGGPEAAPAAYSTIMSAEELGR